MKTILNIVAALTIIASVGCGKKHSADSQFAPQPPPDKTFYIDFEDNPEIDATVIHFKGLPVAEIIDKKLGSGSQVSYTITVKHENQHLMTASTIFVAEDKNLIYDKLEGTSAAIEDGSRMKGYTSRNALRWHLTKEKAGSTTNGVLQKAGSWYDRLKN